MTKFRVYMTETATGVDYRVALTGFDRNVRSGSRPVAVMAAHSRADAVRLLKRILHRALVGG